jgi:hypothetical protein
MYYNYLSQLRSLNENVSTGRSRAARAGLTSQKPHETAAEIRAQAARARAALSSSQERQKQKEERKKELEAKRASIQPLPSRGVGPEEKVLTRKRVGGKTPYGIARSRLARLKKNAQDMNISIDDTVRLHKRIEKMQNAMSNKKNWGVKEELDFIIDYLIDEGYTDTINSAIHIAENMSDKWLYSILID